VPTHKPGGNSAPTGSSASSGRRPPPAPPANRPQNQLLLESITPFGRLRPWLPWQRYAVEDHGEVVGLNMMKHVTAVAGSGSQNCHYQRAGNCRVSWQLWIRRWTRQPTTKPQLWPAAGGDLESTLFCRPRISRCEVQQDAARRPSPYGERWIGDDSKIWQRAKPTTTYNQI